LLGQYFTGANFESLKKSRTDAKIDFSGDKNKLSAGLAKGREEFSVRWAGQVKSDFDEAYTFHVIADGGSRLWVNETLVIDNWSRDKHEATGTINFKAGRWYSIQLDFHARGENGAIQLLQSSKSVTKGIIPSANLRPTSDPRESFPDPYVAPPDFLEKPIQHLYEKEKAEFDKQMDLSFEPTFYTLNDLSGYSKPEPRSSALVRAALEKEQQGEFREALEIHQKVIEQHPDDLYRISKFGIYVPVSQYCQRRILRFPPADLAFYRSKYDAPAKEAYEQAVRKNSLEGLAEIVQTMLATSYGGRAALALGDAALDRGHFLEALEHYETIRDIFPDADLHTPELSLKIEYCHKMLGDPPHSSSSPAAGAGPGTMSAEDRAKFAELVASAKREKPPFESQLTSAPNDSADDYTLHPPTTDPLGLKEPIWKDDLPGTRYDCFVFSQPVMTRNSVIFRHKNIIYCRSILTGALRWKNDLGGRVSWQDVLTREYPQEDILVQDGMVFSPMQKMGPTLVALDEVTGQLKWAYGPMVAANREESLMRFESAPAGGPRAVYAGYVLDDIDGDTHIDTEYGVMAFESTTGRVLWRRPICRYRPGLFSAGMANHLRNKIRSFTSPPLYREGTVYYSTNAGAVVALDAISGRVKWAMRYPYYSFNPDVHDFSRQFGEGGIDGLTKQRAWTSSPMLWYDQRPLLIGDNLYVLPVDSPLLLCINRRNGSVLWTYGKGTGGRVDREGHPPSNGSGGAAYLLGATQTGEIAITYSGERSRGPGAIHLLDPATGKVVWESGPIIAEETQPVLKYRHGDGNSPTGPAYCTDANNWNWQNAARPFISTDGKICFSSYTYLAWPWFGGVSHIAEISLPEKKVLQERRYIGGEILGLCAKTIGQDAPNTFKRLSTVAFKDAELKKELKILEDVSADTLPVNHDGPFLPFSRLTAMRYGTTFEFRMTPRGFSMLYDRDAVQKYLASREDPQSLFAQAELASGDGNLDDAAGRMTKCLAMVSSEDVDFLAGVNQQLYKVYKALAQGDIRASRADQELANCRAMSKSVSSLSEETETLFALAEAYEHKQDYEAAGRMLQSIIGTYGHYEFPIPSALGAGREKLLATAQEVFDKGRAFTQNTLLGPQINAAQDLTRKGLPLYFSSLSPLDKDLYVRAGDLAVERLARLQSTSPEFAKHFGETAKAQLDGKDPTEQLQLLWQFPGTAAAQNVLTDLAHKAALGKSASDRQMLWELADIASVCALKLPDDCRDRAIAPPPAPAPPPLVLPPAEKEYTFPSDQEIAWLLLDRHDDFKIKPNYLFVGGRLKKRLDYFTFLLQCVDMNTGKVVWQGTQQSADRWTDEIRLAGKGNEPGFFEAFISGDVVVVHGLYDVIAFSLADGKLRWHYRVPFDFEIKHAISSGDILTLAGKAETLSLYLPTDDPRGEVIWQEKEEGDIYLPPWFRGDREICVRKLPFNVTVRYRSTGKLIGRLALPDLSFNTTDPLVENGPPQLPAAQDGRFVVLTDSYYYIMVDVREMKVVWKRLLDQTDVTRDPAIRFALKGDYLAIVKDDFDRKAIYMLSSRTGEILWNNDPKKSETIPPLYSMQIDGERLLGIEPHPGQGFYVVGLDCKTGKKLFKRIEEQGYQARPIVRLLPELYGPTAVGQVRDGQDFEIKTFDLAAGKFSTRVAVKGVGDWSEHGHVSVVIQNGGVAILSKDKLTVSANP
jgi:outer membrane protein assembly factor BamB